jgi:hypothetical protein
MKKGCTSSAACKNMKAYFYFFEIISISIGWSNVCPGFAFGFLNTKYNVCLP